MTLLCQLADIPADGARGLEIDGQALVVVRHEGQVHVYVNWCPHLGIELNFRPDEFFDIEHRFLQCANHGALFEIDSGLCILGPCQGGMLKKVGFAVEGGAIRILSIPGQAD